MSVILTLQLNFKMANVMVRSACTFHKTKVKHKQALSQKFVISNRLHIQK